ncbi:hypothetical protein MRX96_022482 [Rhipicephalus microplus]
MMSTQKHGAPDSGTNDGFPRKRSLVRQATDVEDDDSSPFPSTIADFGYFFNDFGQLRHLKTGEPYQFYVRSNDHGYNQRRYEALGGRYHRARLPALGARDALDASHRARQRA